MIDFWMATVAGACGGLAVGFARGLGARLWDALANWRADRRRARLEAAVRSQWCGRCGQPRGADHPASCEGDGA